MDLLDSMGDHEMKDDCTWLPKTKTINMFMGFLLFPHIGGLDFFKYNML